MLIRTDLALPTLVRLTGAIALGLVGGTRELAAQQPTRSAVIQEDPSAPDDRRCQGRGRLIRRADAPEDRNLNGFVCEDPRPGGPVGDDSLAAGVFLPLGELFTGQRRGNVGPPPGSVVDRRDYVSCFGPSIFSTVTPSLVIHAGAASRTISGANTRLCLTRDAIVRPQGETYILNQSYTNGHAPSGDQVGWQTWVTVFARDAVGNATPIRSFDIPARGVGAASGFAVDWQGRVYVASEPEREISRGSIEVFAAGANGNVPPIRTFYGQDGVLAPTAIALDAVDTLYVTNRDYAAVRVYAPGAKADSPAVRLIGGLATRLLTPVGLVLDRRQRLYVADMGAGILLFGRGANGDVAPRRMITPDLRHSALARPRLVALDSRGSLYVGGQRGAGVYVADAFGESEPLQFVAGDSAPESFAFDGLDRLYALRRDTVSVFAPGSWNRRGPIRVIAAASGVSAMAVDRRGTLYLANADSSFIAVYSPEASGKAAPARRIAGDRTRLSRPSGLVVDRRDNLYVVNGEQPRAQPSVQVYAPAARGEPEPVRVIAGSRTGIARVTDIAFDGRGDIYLADGDKVAVFDAGATGDQAPSRTLTGPQTGLRHALKLAIGRGDTLYVLDGYILDRFAFRRMPPQDVTVAVYPPMAGGAIAPLRTILIMREGKSEGLPAGVQWGPADMVVDSSGAVHLSFCMPSPVVAVYAPGANGAVAPVRVEAQNTVGLTGAAGLTLGCGDGFHVLARAGPPP
jgi:sugar lactone lactonase YvrE